MPGPERRASFVFSVCATNLENCGVTFAQAVRKETYLVRHEVAEYEVMQHLVGGGRGGQDCEGETRRLDHASAMEPGDHGR